MSTKLNLKQRRAKNGGEFKSSGDKATILFAEYKEAIAFGDKTGLGNEPGIQKPGVKWLWVTQLLTAMYFIYFLIVLPVLGLVERPKDEPESIHHSVSKTSAA